MSERRGLSRVAQVLALILFVALPIGAVAQTGSLGPAESLDATAVPRHGEPSAVCGVCTRRHNARLKRRKLEDQCRIKGTTGAAGERVYLLPDDSRYDRTDIDPAKGERWFCTEAEAQAAGWTVGGK
jgi:hypothetical protein